MYLCRTRICGRDNGTEEKAIGVVELVSQLSDHLHQFDHAVHQIPEDGEQRVQYVLIKTAGKLTTAKYLEKKVNTHPITKHDMAVPRKA